MYRHKHPYYNSKCTCCRAISMDVIYIPLLCEGDKVRMHVMNNVKACRCELCKKDQTASNWTEHTSPRSTHVRFLSSTNYCMRRRQSKHKTSVFLIFLVNWMCQLIRKQGPWLPVWYRDAARETFLSFEADLGNTIIHNPNAIPNLTQKLNPYFSFHVCYQKPASSEIMKPG